MNEHTCTCNQYTLTEINSTNSLCLHVTAFANSSGNIATVTSAFSPETKNSSSYVSLRFALSFSPIFLFFCLSWSLIIKLPYKTTGIKTNLQFSLQPLYRQFKEKHGSNSMQQHEPLLNVSYCEIKCVNTIIKNKALTHIQLV